ncbi:FeoA family protein [Listeria booriae]|uniref:FeoA family protein n=1 Tax=Listeria booriae TaxID=1552123 RepID=UPI001629A106|nr:ferrous iron transport protein A [Listeria booriae]MBC2105397.1 ferrous iron transport protein A [Listeria booriae]
MEKKLNEVAIGEFATITKLDVTNPMLEKRLLALGCKAGCEVCIKQKGLFGGPCTFETKGQYISIRNCDACAIKVEMQ